MLGISLAMLVGSALLMLRLSPGGVVPESAFAGRGEKISHAVAKWRYLRSQRPC